MLSLVSVYLFGSGPLRFYLELTAAAMRIRHSLSMIPPFCKSCVTKVTSMQPTNSTASACMVMRRMVSSSTNERRKHYFDLAGDVPQQYEEEWNEVEDPGEEFPEEFCYTLTGNAQTLDGVEKLINDLCQQFGTPGNELGLYVPQQMLMKLLVGSDSIYYRGNVISMERQAPDTLVITTEADKGEPLLYAMRECFENLNVEMK